MKNSNINIAVLCGGNSSERDISINSAYSVYAELKSQYNTEVVEYKNDFNNVVNKLKEGGVDNVDMLVILERAIFKVLGIGVADKDKTCAFGAVNLNFSF